MIWLQFVVSGILLFCVFFTSHSAMIRSWQRDDYNYCYLIPFVILYMIWDRRKKLAVLPTENSSKGLILFLPGIILFWLGELGGEFYTLYLSSFFILVGIVWMLIGWEKIKVVLFPLIFLLAMFPPPRFVYNNLSLNLKIISSKVSVAAMHAIGIAAYREGNIIDLGYTKLQFVDACSGFRYLIPLIVLSLLLAYFTKAALWKRIVLVLSAIPISIIVNAIRIILVALLFPIWGAKVTQGFFHEFSGWFMFVVSIGSLLFETWILRMIGKQNIVSAEKATNHITLPKSINANNETAIFQPLFIVAVLLLSLTLFLSRTFEFRENVPVAKSFNDFPLRIGEWIGQPKRIYPHNIDSLDLSDHANVNYRNEEGKTINFFVAYYESQRKGESIHSPESCLPGAGWVFNKSGLTTLILKNHTPTTITVNSAFIKNREFQQLCYFWFPGRGRILTSLYQLKLYNFWDALTRHRTDGALVRLITPVNDNESLDVAEKRLQGFVQEVIPVLENFLPK